MKSFNRDSTPNPRTSAILLLVTLLTLLQINTFAQDKSTPLPEATAAVWDLENLSRRTLSGETIAALTQHIRVKVFSVLPNYRWIERGRITEVLDEQKFQASGCTDQSCAVEMGQLLGARKMVTGSLSKTGDTYNLTLSIIDIETGLVDKNASEICPDCTEGQLYQLADRTVLALAGRPAKKLKPAMRPGPQKGRVNLDVNYPGLGLRYFFSEKTAVEVRGQYLSQNSDDTGVDARAKTSALVLGTRLYRYGAGSSLRPYLCVEADYLSFKGAYSKGSGAAAGLFGGIEYFLGRALSVQTDIGAAYIAVEDKDTAFTDSGVDYIMNFGVNFYFNTPALPAAIPAAIPAAVAKSAAAVKKIPRETGWVTVPGDPALGTRDFQIMAYEARNVGGTAASRADLPPWVNIDHPQAVAACEALGNGAHLPTIAEVQTINRNIEAQPANWADGVIGSLVSAGGGLKRGNIKTADSASYNGGDPDFGTAPSAERTMKAKLVLSNGGEIWDWSGNVWERIYGDGPEGTQGTPNGVGFETSGGNQWDLPALTEERQVLGPSNSGWTVANGMGYYYGGTPANAMIRGGGWLDGTGTGVFAFSADRAPSWVDEHFGFRCAR